MNSGEFVIPVKTGIQGNFKYLRRLDSSLGRNDRTGLFPDFFSESINTE
jgi:hypothetical protein